MHTGVLGQGDTNRAHMLRHRPPPARLGCPAHPAPPWVAVQQVPPLQEVCHHYRGQGPGISLSEREALALRDLRAPRYPVRHG
eukprot:5921404-Pyramimonas_sp.AAC.1